MTDTAPELSLIDQARTFADKAEIALARNDREEAIKFFSQAASCYRELQQSPDLSYDVRKTFDMLLQWHELSCSRLKTEIVKSQGSRDKDDLQSPKNRLAARNNLRSNNISSSTSSIASILATARGVPDSSHTSMKRNPALPSTSQRNPVSTAVLPKNDLLNEKAPSTVQTAENFEKFWGVIENMVTKLSHPLAFTSAPLDGTDPTAIMQESFLMVNEDRTLSKEKPGSKTYEELALETQHQKKIINDLSKRVSFSESLKESVKRSNQPSQEIYLRNFALEQENNMLKQEVGMAKQEVSALKGDAEKMKEEIRRYEKKWAKLMANARKRREPNVNAEPGDHAQ